MKYSIIRNLKPGPVADSVNASLQEGWELYGSLCVADGWVYQAMVKKEPWAKMPGQAMGTVDKLETKWLPNP